MSADSPAVILFDTNGNEVTLADGYSITVDTRGVPVIIVNDSDEAKIMRADADGYLLSSSRINEELPAGTNIIGKIGIDSANTGGLALETTLSSLEGKDFATESTLSDAYDRLVEIEDKDFATETTLTSIKDTEGIKKITDPLPIGDNDIGRVKLIDAYSTQVPTIDGYVLEDTAPGLPAMGKKYTDDTATFLRMDSDGYLQISNAADADEEEKRANSFLADTRYLAPSATTYLIAIDLDNGSGNYKHTVYNKLYFSGISGTIIKSKVNSSWTVSFGVIVRIDGTDADLAILEFGTLAAVDTSKASDHIIVVLRDGVNITVSGGDFDQISAGYIETTTAINTGIQLEDVNGDLTTPGVGDVIYRIENNFGGGTLDFHYSIGYRVE